MYRLTDEQLRSIQAYIDKAEVEMSEIGLRLEISSDMEAWTRFMEGALEIARINTTYDPRYSNANSENCFWISAKDERDEIVGCVCDRVFRTDNFLDQIRNNLLFYDKKPIQRHVELDLVYPPNMQLLSGNVGHGGGLWVRPDYRGTGLSRYLPPLVRALALRHFDLDWNTVVTKNTANRKAMARDRLAYDQQYVCSVGYWPPYDENVEMQFHYIGRDGILAQVEENLLMDSRLTAPQQLERPTPRRGTPSAA